MSQLLACPFCRELFDRTETQHCPDCELPLEPLHRLSPAYDASDEEAVRWEQTQPEDEPLPARDLSRGRGALLAIASLSLLVFGVAPWVHFTSPSTELRSGYSLARGPLGFLWGGALAWVASVGLAASRRTVRQMRGVRAILMLFAAMTGSEILVLLVLSPSSSPEVHVAFEWGYGLYVSLGASLLGSIVAARFGGALPATEPASDSHQPNPEQTLH